MHFAINRFHRPGCLTLPSPKERVLKKSEVKVLSFGEDLGEAKSPDKS